MKFRVTGRLPEKANDSAACYDCYVREIRRLSENKIQCLLGFHVEIPKGWKGVIVPRSSISKTGWILANSIGIIDEDYRGEVSAVFHSIEDSIFPYAVGDRCCQLYFDKVNKIKIKVVDKLSDTERGSGGYGSTGR